MSLQWRTALAVLGWALLVSVVHLALNTRAFDWSARPAGSAYKVGFLPVT